MALRILVSTKDWKCGPGGRPPRLSTETRRSESQLVQPAKLVPCDVHESDDASRDSSYGFVDVILNRKSFRLLRHRPVVKFSAGRDNGNPTVLNPYGAWAGRMGTFLSWCSSSCFFTRFSQHDNVFGRHPIFFITFSLVLPLRGNTWKLKC